MRKRVGGADPDAQSIGKRKASVEQSWAEETALLDCSSPGDPSWSSPSNVNDRSCSQTYLFNLCLEPRLQTVGTNLKDLGVFIRPDEANDRIGFPLQVDADDVILISRTALGMKLMLNKLEEFTRWVTMDVNVKKCVTASSLIDSNGNRCRLAENLMFDGSRIPSLTLAESLRYLGTTVAARRTIKLEATEMRIRLEKMIDSLVLIVQKVDAIKAFLFPKSDFMLLDGDVTVLHRMMCIPLSAPYNLIRSVTVVILR
jgi:hypothetical protein